MAAKKQIADLALTFTLAAVTGLAHAQGAVESYSYDRNGFVDTHTDRNGNFVDYDYDSRGLEVARTEAVGTQEQRTVTTEWHPVFRLPTRRLEPGRETLYEYWGLGDERDGQLRSVTVRDTANPGQPERVTAYDWYANGLLKEIDGPRTDVLDKTTYSYDPATGNLLSVTNALGHVTEVLNHDAWGRPTEIRDPNGVITTLQYHPRGWLRFVTVAGQTTEFRYRPYGKIEQVIFPDGSSLSYDYDAAQRVTAISDNLGNRIEYLLDTFGNAEVTEYSDRDGVLKRRSRAVYDRFDQLEALYGGDEQQTLYTNDVAGNLDAVQNARGHTTTYPDPDGLNRLRETTDPLGGNTRYDFDALDNLTAVTDPRGNTTSYAVNAFGDVIAETSPDRGVTTFSYDAAGNLTSRTDARGVTVTYSHDALNRLTGVDYPDDALDVIYGYDEAGRTYAIGRLTSMTDEVGTTTYDYDERGNLTGETRTILGQSYRTDYEYDAADNLTTMTYPAGRVVSYLRDAAGQVSAVTTTVEGVTQTVAENISYLPFGPISSLDYGNGLVRRHDHDLDYFLREISVGVDPLAPDTLHLTLNPDPVGNVASITDELDPSRSQGFSYDPLDRLTDASGAYGLLGYRYDANGNRTELLQEGSSAETYAIDPAGNRLQGISGDRNLSYGYDAMGNVTGIGTQSFVYDDRGRLVQAGGASYHYNGDGERSVKVAGGQATVFHYDQAGNLIAETTADGSVIREYLYLEGQRLAMVAHAPAEASEELRFDGIVQGGTASLGLVVELDARTIVVDGPQGFANSYSIDEGDWQHGEGELTFVHSSEDRRRRLSGTLTLEAEPLTGSLSLRALPRVDFYRLSRMEGDGSYTGTSTVSGEPVVVQIDEITRAITVRENGAEAVTYTIPETSWRLWRWQRFWLLSFKARVDDVNLRGLIYRRGDRVMGRIVIREGSSWRQTYQLTGNPVTKAAGPGGLYYLHTDHLDTVQVITDQNGEIVWRGLRKPFGETEAIVELVDNPLRFAGQYYDADTGLHYNYFRDYDPKAGRYVQSDPIGIAGGINVYSYSDSRPTVLTDLRGLFSGFPPGTPAVVKQEAADQAQGSARVLACMFLCGVSGGLSSVEGDVGASVSQEAIRRSSVSSAFKRSAIQTIRALSCVGSVVTAADSVRCMVACPSDPWIQR